MRKHQILFACLGLVVFATSARSEESVPSRDASSGESFPSISSSAEAFVKKWWNGTGGLGSWFGLHQPLADRGLNVSGFAKEAYFGGVSGGLPNQPKSNWAGEVKLNLLCDGEKLFGIEGLTMESVWRYRQADGSQNTASTGLEAGTVGSAAMFNPNHMYGGLGIRVLTQQIQWQSDKGNDPRFRINLGWVNPFEQFLQQPLSKLFMNYAIESSKGIGGQAGPGIPVWSASQKKYVTYQTSPVPWSGSYATWGGSLRVKPTSHTYVLSGLYLAISGAAGVQSFEYTPTSVYPYTNVDRSYLGKIRPAGYTQVSTVNAQGQPTGKTTKSSYVVPDQNNHGFNFQGSAKFNPNGDGGLYQQNGLYNVNEVGWTPKLGANKLEGHYAVGGYIWGQDNTSFTPTSYVEGQTKPTAFSKNNLIWGMYFQADQRLYAEREASPAAPTLDQGPAPTSATRPSKTQGLYSFNVFSLTPPQNSAMPFYFQTGLVYKGPIPHRNDDQVGICLGAGFYSSYYNQYIDSQNQALKVAYNGSNATPANTVSNEPNHQYAPHFSSTEVLEAFYSIQLNKWAALNPYAQWIVNPAGNGTVANDLIMGASLKVFF